MAIQEIKSKINDNKQEKERKLLSTALHLFSEKGIKKTSIQDIVHDAGIAKGTFYLYFKDKYDIRNHLIAHKASQVFEAAYLELQAHSEITDFEEQILFVIDHILDQLDANHNLVSLISKHLSWGFVKNSLIYPPGKDPPSILTIFTTMLENAAHTYSSPELMMYMILEIVSGTSYNAILYQQPVPLEELKPHLYKTVKGILESYRVDERER